MVVAANANASVPSLVGEHIAFMNKSCYVMPLAAVHFKDSK